MKKLFVVLAAVLFLAIIACSGGGSNNTSSQSSAVLASNAKQLDSTTTNNLSSVSADGTTLTFSATTTQLGAMNQGDVIISGITTAAPRGLLKKVVSVTTLSDGTVQVTTTPAALTDAFQELHISGTITGVSKESLVHKSVKFIEKALNINISGSINIPDISIPIPSTSFSVSNNYNSSFSGNYKYSPDFIYEIDISNFHLNTYKLELVGDQTFNMDGTCSFENAVSFNPEQSLGDIPAIIIDAGPVVFTIEVIPSVGIDLSAENKLDISTGFTSTISMTAGIEYINGITSPISSYSGSFTSYSTISDQVIFSLRPYLSAKIGFYVYGAAGPYFDLQPYGKFVYVVTPNPHSEISYGIEGSVGGEVKVYDWTLADLSLQLFDINIPYIADTISVQITKLTDLNKPIALAIDSSDINLYCVWGIPALSIINTNTGIASFGEPILGPPLYPLVNDIDISYDDQHLYIPDANYHQIVISGSSSSTITGIQSPTGVAVDHSRTHLYVTDISTNSIYDVNLNTSSISLLAGSGAAGYADGVGSNASFNTPFGITIDPSDTKLYVAERVNNRVRVIDISTKNVSTFAGSGTKSTIDGFGINASFNDSTYITINHAGTKLYVVELDGASIREVNINTKEVKTIVGISAGLNQPRDIVITHDDSILYLADYGNNRILKIKLNP